MKAMRIKSLFDDSVSLFDKSTGEKLTKAQIVKLKAKQAKKNQTKINFNNQ